MVETAIITPLTGDEIIEVCVMEFEKRLKALSPLQLSKQYAAFKINFSHTITLYRMGHNGGGDLETLAWGSAHSGDVTGPADQTIEGKDTFDSGNDPNGVRMAHDLPLTVEVSDGKGGKKHKKVRHKE